jgi:hypothetical protein
MKYQPILLIMIKNTRINYKKYIVVIYLKKKETFSYQMREKSNNCLDNSRIFQKILS